MTLDIRPLTPFCGAEIHGLDLARGLDAETAEALGSALAERGVLFFRDQQLKPEQQKKLGQYFGPLHIHPTWPRLVDGHPEVMELLTDQDSTRIAGENWHSDVSCDTEPPLGSILYMLETPPIGGDTLFAHTQAAFDALSSPLRDFLEELTAIHDGEQVYRRGYGGAAEEKKSYPRAEHPIVRTHPINGRKGLFVNRTFTTSIVQLASAESDALLEFLFSHCEKLEFQCRFKWQPGSVAFWDNRCVLHHALWDYYPHRRLARRVTITGDAPY